MFGDILTYVIQQQAANKWYGFDRQMMWGSITMAKFGRKEASLTMSNKRQEAVDNHYCLRREKAGHKGKHTNVNYKGRHEKFTVRPRFEFK